jgi:RNA polymerase sigma factor (sigma-70 family)
MENNASKQAVSQMEEQYNRIVDAGRTPDVLTAALAEPRTDGPSLAERFYQAARGEYWDNQGKQGRAIDIDDAFQSMITHASAAILDDPELTSQSYAYIITKARWKLRDDQRHARRSNASAIFELDKISPNPEDESENHERLTSVHATDGLENANLALDLKMAIAQIDDRRANAFLLRFAYGYTHKEIARMMDTTPNATDILCRHARKELRKRLPHRKPAREHYTRLTVRKFASLPATGWTHARTEDATRVVKGAAKTEKFHRYTITYGNDERETIDHRKTVQVLLATPDDLTTTETPERQTRTPSPDAPAPERLICPPKWTEYNYQEVYQFSDLDPTGIDRERPTRLPMRNTFGSKDERLTCYNWTHYQDDEGACPVSPDMDAPAPDDLAQWLEDYNASI